MAQRPGRDSAENRGQGLSTHIAARVRSVREQLGTSRCIFDWFAALHTVLGFHQIASDHLAREDDIAQASARLRLDYGASLTQSLTEDFPQAPQPLLDAITSNLIELETQAQAAAVEPDTVIALLGTLTAIDSVFSGLGFRATSSGANEILAESRARLETDGNLVSTPATWGLVIPSAAPWSVSEGLPRLLHGLCHIPVLDDTAVRYRRVATGHPIRPSLGTPLAVGFIALVQNSGELAWAFRRNAGGVPVYSVVPHPAHITTLINRLTRSMDILADHADLIVLPELVACDEIVAAMTTWLQRRSRQDNARLPAAVLIGSQWQASTGTSPARNRSRLLVGQLGHVLEQYKLNPYTMLKGHHGPLNLPGADPNVDYLEDISGHPPIVELVDIAGLGRIAVQICEDLNSNIPWDSVLRHAGLQLLLCPVMNGPQPNQWDWILRAGIQRANSVGASMIVVNSGTMIPGNARAVDLFARGYAPRRSSHPPGFHLVPGQTWDVDNDGLEDCWVLRGSDPHLTPMS